MTWQARDLKEGSWYWCIKAGASFDELPGAVPLLWAGGRWRTPEIPGSDRDEPCVCGHPKRLHSYNARTPGIREDCGSCECVTFRSDGPGIVAVGECEGLDALVHVLQTFRNLKGRKHEALR